METHSRIMTPQSHPLDLPDVEFEAFHLLGYGQVAAPSVPSRFGFQLDMKHVPGVHEIVFGLVQPSNGRESEQREGFAVRVNLELGEIWDLVNGSGLIGWLEEPAGWAEGERQDSLLLSLEIERVGSALLPKLQIGGEEWLYPAIRCADELEFIAIAGCEQRSGQMPVDCFINPTVWSEDMRAYA